MTELRTEIALKAPAERLWELLSDFTLYPQWNPLIVQAQGEATEGTRLEMTVQLPAIPPFPIKPTLLCADPQCRLLWRHSLAFPALMCWSYGLELEQLDQGRLKLVQKSTFGGLLGPLFTFALRRSVEQGMSEFNKAVARWGEQGNVRCLRC
ncbi:SRPBCC domain-containing protein [Geomonas sp.]|uniref:SRPBCC domain-containing protein n=1 Tax=Geomonas sp. TaxID=2651584 RepID=UPI002B468EB0|nr:SRPBCC domain-containing protein [Geomonas sp.]HJV34511.1 SRPBCC domain-containing protein [Geomonas sp.]